MERGRPAVVPDGLGVRLIGFAWPPLPSPLREDGAVLSAMQCYPSCSAIRHAVVSVMQWYPSCSAIRHAEPVEA